MGALRISRIQLRDFGRHHALDVAPAPGLTVVKGPNEAGKSTLAEAIALGLAPAGGASAEQLRTWGAPPSASPGVTIDFSVVAAAGRRRDARPSPSPGRSAGPSDRAASPRR